MKRIYKAPKCYFKYEKLDEPVKNPYGGADFKYKPLTAYHYYSKRYDKWCTISLDDYSNGSSGGRDIESLSWWVHDMLCRRGVWDDGTKLTNLECSTVIYDILVDEGRWFRARTWWCATLLGGGGKARKNGMFKLKGE